MGRQVNLKSIAVVLIQIAIGKSVGASPPAKQAGLPGTGFQGCPANAINFFDGNPQMQTQSILRIQINCHHIPATGQSHGHVGSDGGFTHTTFG